MLHHPFDQFLMYISRGFDEMESLFGQVLFGLALDESIFPEFDLFTIQLLQ